MRRQYLNRPAIDLGIVICWPGQPGQPGFALVASRATELQPFSRRSTCVFSADGRAFGVSSPCRTPDRPASLRPVCGRLGPRPRRLGRALAAFVPCLTGCVHRFDTRPRQREKKKRPYLRWYYFLLSNPPSLANFHTKCKKSCLKLFLKMQVFKKRFLNSSA